MEKKKCAVIFLIVFFMLVSLSKIPTIITSTSSMEVLEPMNSELVKPEYQTAAEIDGLKMNVNQNPGFEDYDVDNWPSNYGGFATGYAHSSAEYTDIVYSGSYAGYISSYGVRYGNAHAYLSTNPDAMLSDGLTLNYWYRILSNPDLISGSNICLRIFTTNETNHDVQLWYYLNYHIVSDTNVSTTLYYMMNSTINDWHYFSRNLVDDWDTSILGALDSGRYIQTITWHVDSSETCNQMTELVIDEVDLTNATYSGWLLNGDFEYGTGVFWNYNNYNPPYVAPSTDCTEDDYSLNMTVLVESDTSYVKVRKPFYSFYSSDHPATLFPDSHGSIVVEFDWKFTCNVGATPYQYASMDFYFSNDTHSRRIHFIIGFGQESIFLTNGTFEAYFIIDGYSDYDTWHHASLDLYDYVVAAGFASNYAIDNLDFYVIGGGSGTLASLLVDDFQIIAYPTGDPGFEQDWYESLLTPFAGWKQSNGETGVISRTYDSHSGIYACNLTPSSTSSDWAGVYREMYVDIRLEDSLDIWWRLDKMSDNGGSRVYMQIELNNNYYISYLLGSSESYSPSNVSNLGYIYVDNYNTTGIWNNLNRNITYDVEELFSTSEDLFISSINFETYSLYEVQGSGVSLIVDDVHIKDRIAPTIDSVSILTTMPEYTEPVSVQILAFDERPGISEVQLIYSINNWTTDDIVIADYSGGQYIALVPAQTFNTEVEFYVVAIDGCGLQTINDNDGLNFSYTVWDYTNPLVSVDSPSDFADVEGKVLFNISAVDIGSDLTFVEYFINGDSQGNDTLAPFEYEWDTDALALGGYTFSVIAHDNAGNNASDSIDVNVVDTILPEINSPMDIGFIEGESGHSIVWNPTDLRPASYKVYINSALSQSGAWNSSSEKINITLDGLTAAAYNYTCLVYDDGGNYVSDTIVVNVIELIAPSINSPDDITFTEGAIDQSIAWNGTDLNPHQYVILQDGISVATGTWNSSSEIIRYSLAGITHGIYNFTCVLYDDSGNWVSDSVIVIVNESTSTTLITTTTTDTSTTPTDGGDFLTPLLVVGIIGILLVVIVVLPKMKVK